MFLTKGQLPLAFQSPSHVCCFSENNQLETTNMPKRHILGWQVLLPYSQKARDPGKADATVKVQNCCRIPSCLEKISLLVYSDLQLIR